MGTASPHTIIVAIQGGSEVRFEPGFVKELQEDLNNVKPEIKAKQDRPGALVEKQLLSLCCATPQEVVDGEHARPSDVVRYDELTSWQPAVDAIRAGEIAFVVLAGGAGTRAGGPKAFMRLPKLGMTLMANKLVQSGFTTHDGEAIQAQTWFMTAPEHLERFGNHLIGLVPQPSEGVVFEQFESYRLAVNNRIVFTEPGVPELYPTGHGDIGPALIESGVLDDHPNVKHCVIVNCDNVLASLDPIILSRHLEAGVDVTCELIDREKKDAGGVPVWVDNKLQVVENFRLPDGFIDGALYHNTNSFIISVEALKTSLPWRWHRIRKQVGNRLVIQYERLIQQYTEAFSTQYIVVDRKRRYLPVKVEGDLERADEFLNGNRL